MFKDADIKNPELELIVYNLKSCISSPCEATISSLVQVLRIRRPYIMLKSWMKLTVAVMPSLHSRLTLLIFFLDNMLLNSSTQIILGLYLLIHISKTSSKKSKSQIFHGISAIHIVFLSLDSVRCIRCAK